MKISVITAVFNARETIAGAVESVLSQSHPDIELIVIDGASTDGTAELLRSSFSDQISTFISEPDHGIYDALNKGIRHATGDVIGFLHADDLFADRDVLTRIAEGFANQSVDGVYGDLVYVSKTEPNKVIRYWKAGAFSPDKLRKGWMPPHPTFYVRSSIYEQLGIFDTSLHIAADYDCMLRLLHCGGIQVHYVPEVLVKMRVGGKSNHSLGNVIRKSAEDYRALKNNNVGGLTTLIAKNLSKVPQFFKRNVPSKLLQ